MPVNGKCHIIDKNILFQPFCIIRTMPANFGLIGNNTISPEPGDDAFKMGSMIPIKSFVQSSDVLHSIICR